MSGGVALAFKVNESSRDKQSMQRDTTRETQSSDEGLKKKREGGGEKRTFPTLRIR